MVRDRSRARFESRFDVVSRERLDVDAVECMGLVAGALRGGVLLGRQAVAMVVSRRRDMVSARVMGVAE